jgi:hypothetical protein
MERMIWRTSFLLRCMLAATALGCMLAALSCTPGKRQVRIYAMGERAEAGKIVYSVLESSWRKQLGDQLSPRLPQREFLLLRLSVTNGGTVEAAVPHTTLVAPSGTEYSELTDGSGVDEWMGVLRHIKPNETQFGWVMFDAPRGDYQLRVTDDAFDPADAINALVQIPLKMESKSEALPDPKPNR